MKHEISAQWKDPMAFEVSQDGHKFTIDAATEAGGENSGPRPKALMLSALAGCTGMDVISILKKMRIIPEYFNVRVEGSVTEEHPKEYEKMHIVYEFKGDNLDKSKIEKAVNLSQEKYCGVSDFYRKVVDVTYEIKILD